MLTDNNKGTVVVQYFQARDANTHGIHVHDGVIILTWKEDDLALDGVTYTSSAQSFDPSIRWTVAGPSQFLGFVS